MTNTPLNVTQQANHRVFVGLGWDPVENVSLKDRALKMLGLKNIHHDLDLACYIYDANKHYIGHVSIESGHEVDQTGKIYHSGDNVEGVGAGDDEQISVELKDLDPAIQAIVFQASIKSGQTFDQVTEPEIRLADGYSGHDFAHVALGDLQGNNQPAYVFMALLKNPEGQWLMRHIGEFTGAPAGDDWAGWLKKYV